MFYLPIFGTISFPCLRTCVPTRRFDFTTPPHRGRIYCNIATNRSRHSHIRKKDNFLLFALNQKKSFRPSRSNFFFQNRERLVVTVQKINLTPNIFEDDSCMWSWSLWQSKEHRDPSIISTFQVAVSMPPSCSNLPWVWGVYSPLRI